MKTIIVWFRNDLRVHDHPALAVAASDADQVIPIFIFNDKLLHGSHASSNRNRFLIETLDDLRRSLQAIGSNLVIRAGDPSEVLRDLAAETNAAAVYYTIDYSPYARSRDQRVTEDLTEHDIGLRAFPGRLALDSFKGVVTQTDKVYRVFTPFWKNWAAAPRRQLSVTPSKLAFPSKLAAGRLPALATLTTNSDLSPDVQTGGETAGRQRLQQFLDDGIQHYADNHGQLVPQGGTSMLSPYLHFGCISVRQIEDMLPDGKGPAAFHRQLAWRDFYHYILFHYPANVTQEFQERYRDMEWQTSPRLLKAWQQGQTGYPVVDAAMRQLLREGWMHNRARLIVGSFLTKDLALDWRAGEAWFMRMLLDGDEANNNGNWQWIASVGVDPAPAFRRMYNPASQQKNYDPDGAYVRHYVPELAKVSDKYLAEPWKMDATAQKSAGCVIGSDYPEPIVDHAEARRQALERYRVS